MPLYHATVRPGILSPTQRQSFAGAVVDVHCRVTGAPPSFVHVIVSDDDARSLPEDRAADIVGTIRAGRTDDQKDDIARGLGAALAVRAGVDVDAVTTSIVDIEASFTMEAGVLLPEPGSAAEQEWMTHGSSDVVDPAET